jgi:hypothetical protein
MEQDSFLLQDQDDVMDVVVADKVEALRRKGWALEGHAQVDLALDTPSLGTLGLETYSP